MNTESFAYGSFGLAVFAAGYVAIIIKITMSTRAKASVYGLSEYRQRTADGKETVSDQTDGRLTSAIMKTVSLLVHNGSSARKSFKLAMKFDGLAVETALLYQKLEPGLPTVLIGIFTAAVTSNALSCAAVMFIPYERSLLKSSSIACNLMIVAFLIYSLSKAHAQSFQIFSNLQCLMLVVLYGLYAFTFDRAKFTINIEVYPTDWLEQSGSVIADPVQTAVINIHKSQVAANHVWAGRLHSDRHQSHALPSASHISERNYPTVVLMIVSDIHLVVFVEESVRPSAIACNTHPECVVHHAPG
ncbi:hypothetical protein PHYSODRAFT_295526 [Phytophthora sojae]|uniref:Uncharacterized protein n=1 Tax=Phytophthora sojae (strain P6497) TaxID=1094619 RepID=G4YRG8_PHYSP|nr:hypothetical protein PHYSODRAFT_295526 [Phytophthora sojae]EGZ22902.1 hypothetical protein PHYSODRAFT_295526 [Phytophthora sojae]|eukprot:XP_009518190.1 hypothetical protein PHYSODRAFT_295526 [Phytophthora sojae]